MTFLHLGLLPLAALAVVPILLHLLTLHRLRTVELSTYRFLFDSYVQQRRQMKFLEALLAMLRTLFMLALVLVICRPVVRHWSGLFGGGGGREAVMLVDCSASMNAKTGGVSALDRAKVAALSIAGRLGRDDRLTLVRLGARPQEVFSRFSSDAETIREKIEALAPGPSRANYFAGLTSVYDSPRGRRGANSSVYLFTDGQAGSWREVRDHGLDRIIPQGSKLTVVEVGSDEAMSNRGVIGDAPRRRQAILGLPLRLRPRVVNHSKTEAADVSVGVFLDEKEVARIPFHLKPGEVASREVVHIPSEPGVVRGRFEIANDRFPDDDSFDFALTVIPQVPVLLVNGHPVADPFENEALFLRTALSTTAEGERASPSASAKPGAAALGPSTEFVRSLDVREIPEGQLNVESLREIGVVILANCGALNTTQFAAIRDYVSAGGGLLIFPGDKVNPDVYNTQFFPLTSPRPPRARGSRRPAATPKTKKPDPKAKTAPAPAGPVAALFTGAKLGVPEGDLAKPQTSVRLATIDYGHPALSVFDDPEAHYLTTSQFSRRFPLLPDEHQEAWPLARYSGGGPALLESRFGEGVVILAGFPVSTRWTNLPLKPEFVPLALRLVSYAAHAPDLDVPSTVPPDGAAEIAVAGTWAPASGKVTDARGRTTRLNLERSASQLLGEFDDTTEKGYYAVEVKGGRLDPPQTASSAFAVNTAAEESNFNPVSEDQVRDWLPRADLTFVNASAEQQQTHGSIGDEREIWRPLIFVLFAIIGAEFLLATMSGQGPVAEDGRPATQRLRDLVAQPFAADG